MFDFAWSEIVLIGAVALIAIGPKDMPAAIRTVSGMIKKALAEGQLSVELFSEYFGPAPYKRLALTQQTACDFGQSWPGLVWLPTCSFFDTTVRHGLGLDFGDRGYWKSVAPHEVAHQWWGHGVGFNSYRDQWMSEGFADMSASLFLQLVEKNPKKFIEFWNDERQLLLERNKEGFRAIAAGPLTMGYRLSNTRSGYDLTRHLIYPKGAYILHMIRMMFYNSRDGDKQFQTMMKDFVQTTPRAEHVVIKGLSGAGKSALAVVKIHAAGERSYVQSLAA